MDWIGTASVVVAVLSAFVSAWFSLRSSHFERRNSVNEYRAQLRDWAARGMHVLARLEASLEAGAPGAGDAGDAGDLAELSALIEEGRLFFPNSRPNPEAPHDPKQPGLRDRKLDPLVVAYRVFRPRSRDPEVADRLKVMRELRKRFTERMQTFLKPTNVDQALEDLTKLEPGQTTFAILSGLEA